eukprot:scaffold2859_cov349-Pavlova_lutheri.AAC.10
MSCSLVLSIALPSYPHECIFELFEDELPERFLLLLLELVPSEEIAPSQHFRGAESLFHVALPVLQDLFCRPGPRTERIGRHGRRAGAEHARLSCFAATKVKTNLEAKHDRTLPPRQALHANEDRVDQLAGCTRFDQWKHAGWQVGANGRRGWAKGRDPPIREEDRGRGKEDLRGGGHERSNGPRPGSLPGREGD